MRSSAKSMVKLPFVVEPRRAPIVELIGSEESGQIQIERRGYLTTGEKAFVQQVQQFDGGASDIITLSRKVSRKHGIAMDKAYNAILSIISNSDADDGELNSQIEEEFAEDLTNIIRSLSAGQVREELVMAACLLRYRVDSEFDITEISRIHPDIISGLARLYRDEDARSLEAFTKEDGEGLIKQESIEEAEKKPAKATPSRSKSTTGG